MAALWTNLHGGFLALVAVLGLAGVGEFLEGRFGEAGPAAFGRSRRYVLLAGACMAASLLNPFGYHLHEHIVAYLRSDWIIDTIDEFRSPNFRGEVMRQYEVLLFGGIALSGYLVAKRRFVEPLLILFWAQASLTSVRHVPLFALVAVPVLCEALTQLWTWASAPASRRSIVGILRDVGRDLALSPRALSIWPFLFVAGLAASGGDRWPRDFPEQVFPVGLVERHAAVLAPDGSSGRRLFAPDGWGGYLIYRFHPRLRVFTDGRSDFYGRELGLEYVRMLNGRHDWESLMDRYGFDLALVPVKVPLAELLKRHPGWTVVEDDGKAILFEKVAASLMDSGISAERQSRSHFAVGKQG
ncbi:MAG: hypothetical protein IPM24_12735 [Bryobacterales bacterium]|nr:hypothetical protein [Bryobacterales bacterium]